MLSYVLRQRRFLKNFGVGLKTKKLLNFTIMADIKQLAEEFMNLTVKEVSELATLLKEEYGLEPAAAAVAVAAPLSINGYCPSTSLQNMPWQLFSAIKLQACKVAPVSQMVPRECANEQQPSALRPVQRKGRCTVEREIFNSITMVAPMRGSGGGGGAHNGAFCQHW